MEHVLYTGHAWIRDEQKHVKVVKSRIKLKIVDLDLCDLGFTYFKIK